MDVVLLIYIVLERILSGESTGTLSLMRKATSALQSSNIVGYEKKVLSISVQIRGLLCFSKQASKNSGLKQQLALQDPLFGIAEISTSKLNFLQEAIRSAASFS